MHHAFRIGDAEFNVELSRTPQGYRLHLPEGAVDVSPDPGCIVAVDGDDVYLHVDGEAWHLHYEHPLERLAQQAQGAGDDAIRAPMPGSLVAIPVKAGDAVDRGQALLVMESMKMETTIVAPRAGIVREVRFGVAQPFERDAVLVTLESGTAP